jgi:uncharacterized membrane protein
VRAVLEEKLPLAMLVVWCMGLLFVRVYYTGRPTFGFLIWNMFLAVVPVLMAVVLRALLRQRRAWPLHVSVFIVWLAFLPNAPYMVTDLIHLSHGQPVPFWFDAALFGSFAATGILLGYVAVADVQTALAERYGHLVGSMVAVGSLLLCGFGIYLGRVLRWNSWDLVTSPLTLTRQVAHFATHPLSHVGIWEISAVCGLGLVVGYAALRSVAVKVEKLPRPF